MSWPPGSTTKILAEIREGDEILIDLTFRMVKSWQDTPQGFVVHFVNFPSRSYPSGRNTTVRVWDKRRDEGVPTEMVINR